MSLRPEEEKAKIVCKFPSDAIIFNREPRQCHNEILRRRQTSKGSSANQKKFFKTPEKGSKNDDAILGNENKMGERGKEGQKSVAVLRTTSNASSGCKRMPEAKEIMRNIQNFRQGFEVEEK